MGHGSYGMTKCPWVMGHANAVQGIVRPMTHGGDIHCTTHDGWRTNFPWVMGRAEGVGGPLPMDHGLYSSIATPWVMGCTVIHLPHGSWVVLYRHDLRRRPMSHRGRRVAYFASCPVSHRLSSQGTCSGAK